MTEVQYKKWDKLQISLLEMWQTKTGTMSTIPGSAHLSVNITNLKGLGVRSKLIFLMYIINQFNIDSRSLINLI